MIREKAEEFNTIYFDNTIDISKISFRISKRMVSTRGTFRAQSIQEITLSALLLENSEEWEKTLIHEMIHAYQFQKGYKMGHGSDFKYMSGMIYFKSGSTILITRTNSFKDEAIKEKVHDIKASKISTQYVIVWPKGKVNFVKGLSEDDISALKKYYDAKIYINNKIHTGVRHCKNYNYLVKARYYYKEDILESLELDEKL